MACVYGRLYEHLPSVSETGRRPYFHDTAVGRGEPLLARFQACASIARPWLGACLHQFPLIEPYVRCYRIRLSDGLSVISIRKKLTALPLQIDQPRPLQGRVHGFLPGE